MFWSAPWDLQATIAGCQATYGTTPRPDMVRLQYGVTDLSSASNIVFTNGDLDPWSSGGVVTNVTGNPSIIAFVIQVTLTLPLVTSAWDHRMACSPLACHLTPAPVRPRPRTTPPPPPPPRV
jgi:hypothetical protein